MWKLIIKTLEKVLFDKNKKTYPEGKIWQKIKEFVWNFNDLLKLVLQGAVYTLLLFVIGFSIYKLFTGTISIVEMLF